MKICKTCHQPFNGPPRVYQCETCIAAYSAANSADINRKLAVRLARETGPFAKELATVKTLIAESFRINDVDNLLLCIRQLADLSKSRSEQQKMQRLTLNPAHLPPNIELLCGVFAQVILSDPNHASLNGMSLQCGTIFTPVEADDVELFIVDLLTTDDPRAEPTLSEQDFYVSDDDPARLDYEQLLLAEDRGRFREPICLVKLCHARFFQVNDRVVLDKCSRALTKLYRQQRASQEFSIDWWVDDDLMRKGKRLEEWLSPMGDAARLLASRFAEIVRAIILDYPQPSTKELPQAHDELLSRFLGIAAGAGEKWYAKVAA